MLRHPLVSVLSRYDCKRLLLSVLSPFARTCCRLQCIVVAEPPYQLADCDLSADVLYRRGSSRSFGPSCCAVGRPIGTWAWVVLYRTLHSAIENCCCDCTHDKGHWFLMYCATDTAALGKGTAICGLANGEVARYRPWAGNGRANAGTDSRPAARDPAAHGSAQSASNHV